MAGRASTPEGRARQRRYVVDNSGDTIVERAGQGSDRVWTSVNYALAAGVSIETFTTTNHTGTGR